MEVSKLQSRDPNPGRPVPDPCAARVTVYSSVRFQHTLLFPLKYIYVYKKLYLSRETGKTMSLSKF